MPWTKKVYRLPLREDWADALLSAHSQDPPLGRSVAERLDDAKLELRNAIGEATSVISKSPLMQTVANAAAKEVGKRGNPLISIDIDGTVMLEIYSKATTKKGDDVPTKVVDLKAGAKKSPLPPLSVLRTVAVELNIDTSGMGRSKKDIMAAIEKKRKEGQKGQTKWAKTAPAAVPSSVVNIDTGMSNGDLPFSGSDLPEDPLEDIKDAVSRTGKNQLS